MIRKQEIPLDGVRLVACSDTRAKDREENKVCGVHFFVDDWRFEGIYRNPEKTLSRYSQYAFLLTPDFSLYADMPLWKQIENVGKNRWVGAYWQNKGLSVIPTIAWSTARSFEFCFDAVEKHSTLAVGMIGCKGNTRICPHITGQSLSQGLASPDFIFLTNLVFFFLLLSPISEEP